MLVSLSEAIALLKAERVVGMPTETVYGLAGRIDSEAAIHEIFAVKKRPFFDPLIVHVASVAQAKNLVASWPSVAQVLAERFWPGPLTMVLPKSERVSGLITSGLPSVGVRMPNHPLALQLIQQTGIPLAAPSANLFGQTSPTCAEHVLRELPVSVLDGGACQVGIESTVLSIRPGNPVQISVLREGQVRWSQIEEVLRQKKENYQILQAISRAESPGHLKHHYMPAVPLILCRKQPKSDEHLRQILRPALDRLPDVVEGIQLRKPKKLQTLLALQLSHEPALAARQLYQRLREESEKSPDVIYFVAPAEFNAEAWSAVKDRLEKAASLVLDEELA